MKTFRIFVLWFFFIPFFSLADSYSLSQSDFLDINRIFIYSFTSFTSSNSFTSSQSSLTPDSVFSVIFNSVNGIKFNLSNSRIYNPSFAYPVSTNANTRSIDYPVEGLTVFKPVGNACYPLSAFDRIPSLYNAVVALYNSGYRGSGIRDVFFGSTSSTKSYVALNFYFPDILSDVLSSTNSAFAKILFDSLSSIGSNVSQLSSNVSSFQQSFQSVNLPVFDFPKYLDSLIENGDASQSSVDSWLSTYNQYSSDPLLQQAFAQAVQRTIDSKRNTEQALQTLQETAHDNPSRLNDVGNAFNGSVEGAVQDFKRLSTNWQEGVKRDLQDWRSDVTNRLAHMFDENISIDGGNSKPVYVSGANGGAVQIAGVVGLANDVTVGVSIKDPVKIDSTSFADTYVKLDSLKTSIDTFKDTFFDWAYDGNKYGNWYSFYRLFTDFQNQSLTNQLSLISRFNFTNILDNIYAAITNQNTNLVISAALLDDYQNFVDTSKFSSIVSSLPADLRDSLSRFGLLDSSDYSGRWWVFQAANMALQSQLALTNAALSSLLSSSLRSLDDYFSDDDDSSSGLLSKWLKLVDDLPEPEELKQTISEATNIVSNVGLERVTVLYDRATNDFSSAVSSVYSDRSLPSSLSFVLIPARSGSPARVVDIPVSDRSSLWSFIRQGMAFGLSIVTLILFPKYLLWLLSHYTRLLEKIIKSLHAYTEH